MLLFNKGYDLLFILHGACLLMVKVIHHINNIIDNILYPIGNRRSLRVFLHTVTRVYNPHVRICIRV
jgi:hypothetical protein